MKHIQCEEEYINTLKLKQTDEYTRAEKSCSVTHEKYWLNQAHMTQTEINATDDRLLKIRIETTKLRVDNEHYKSEAMDYLDKSVRLNEELNYCLGLQDNENLAGPTYHDLMNEERELRGDIKHCDDMVEHYNNKIDWSL